MPAHTVNGHRGPGIHSDQPWFVLDAATHYDLVASHNPWISHFYSFEADQSRGMTLAIPDGCVDIMFDCDQTDPVARVCGTTLEARRADLVHGHSYFGVRFAPGVTPKFLNVGADELVDGEINLLDLMPNAAALFEQILSQSACSHKAALFEKFFEGKVISGLSPLTSWAMQTICQKNGNVRISELEARTGYSRRTLLRRFTGDIGMSIKTFSRIVRGQSAIHNINYRNKVVLSDLACELGFSDQAHFQREFKKLISTTPLNYQSRVRQGAYQERIRYI